MKVIASELARIAGVKKQFIQVEIISGRIIRQKNYLIDTRDDINADWLRRRGVDPDTCKKVGGSGGVVVKMKPARGGGKDKRKPKNKDEISVKGGPSVPAGVPKIDLESIAGLPERLMNLTIRQLVMKYGGPMQLKSYVDIMNTMLSAMKRDVDIQEKRRQLIEKDFVIGHLIQFIDIMQNQLFDYPESIIDEFIAEVKADDKKSRIKLPEKMRKDISRLTKEAKRLIGKEIDHMKKRHEESD